MDRKALTWRKSSKSSAGACVEVAVEGESAFVRDSRDPDGPVLTFSVAAFRAFVTGLRKANG
ncbi:DUF397 domain-containing protein [Dactylosporangium vinaceum]|uniref:DUF397 domain-containing protein n=1 Tax=Dactylosporangium vinaceum TaxID=53362 RepID=A0ABV5MHP0_9ACTN|nr:DUF397 domain-containing protein [Dactylosporangium vinaceum]UAC01663.1 DUF397 domain-containing protein [Dactylosporangium vinaceum]